MLTKFWNWLLTILGLREEKLDYDPEFHAYRNAMDEHVKDCHKNESKEMPLPPLSYTVLEGTNKRVPMTSGHSFDELVRTQIANKEMRATSEIVEELKQKQSVNGHYQSVPVQIEDDGWSVFSPFYHQQTCQVPFLENLTQDGTTIVPVWGSIECGHHVQVEVDDSPSQYQSSTPETTYESSGSGSWSSDSSSSSDSVSIDSSSSCDASGNCGSGGDS